MIEDGPDKVSTEQKITAKITFKKKCKSFFILVSRSIIKRLNISLLKNPL